MRLSALSLEKKEYMLYAASLTTFGIVSIESFNCEFQFETPGEGK